MASHGFTLSEQLARPNQRQHHDGEGPVAEIGRRYNEGRCRSTRCRDLWWTAPSDLMQCTAGLRRSRSPPRPPAPTTV